MASGGHSNVTDIKMSEETFDLVCTDCAEDNKRVQAVKYCIDCSGYLCQQCVETHIKVRSLRNHNLEDVGQGQKGAAQNPGPVSGLLEISTERCSVHKGKVVDMYCELHDDVGCTACFFMNHKTCNANFIHTIPDAISAIFSLSDCKKIETRLKNTLDDMETIGKSKDVKLQKLKDDRKESLDQVDTSQKALEALIRKAADASRQEIERDYKKLEAEILLDKQRADDIVEELQKIIDKLDLCEENRAQRFVCTKIGLSKLFEADRAMEKSSTDKQLSFTADQSLIEYMKYLQGIGQVQSHGKKHQGIYKVKGQTTISLKITDDTYCCNSYGCCVTPENQLLVTDKDNLNVKLIDIQRMSVIDWCPVQGAPNGVCFINKHEAVVACEDKKITFISIIGSKMSVTKQIQTSYPCYGIANRNRELIVTDNNKSLYVYDMSGSLLNTISRDKTGKFMFNRSRHVIFNEQGTRMLVGGGYNGLTCLNDTGHVSLAKDKDLNFADGVCQDGRGNMFVVGCLSQNVIQYSESGQKVGVVVKPGGELQKPRSVAFYPEQNKLFVTMAGSNFVLMYTLE